MLKRYVKYFEKEFFGVRAQKFFKRSIRARARFVRRKRGRRRRPFEYFVFAHKKFILKKYSSMVSLLSSIYGIGRRRSVVLCIRTGVNPLLRPKRVNFKKFLSLKRNLFRSRFVYGRLLSNIVVKSIRKLRESGSYHGYRLRYGLPARGQRTRTNARTSRKKYSSLGF